MTFKIDKTILQNSLTQSSPFLEKKDIKNIASNYFLEVDNCILTICATDYNFSLKLDITSVYDATDGKFLVNGNNLLTTIKRLKSGEVMFTLKGDELTIKQGRSNLKLQTLSTNDYPNIDISENDMKYININNDLLYNAIKKTLFSVDSNNPKHELNSMLFDFSKTLKIVSSNTRALSVYDTGLEFENESQILIPKSAVVEIQKIILHECDIFHNETYLKIKAKDMIFTTKLINGRFPDYKRVISTSHNFKFKVPTNELIENIKLITALEDLVRITFDTDAILLESGEGKLISNAEIKLVQECKEPISIKVSSNQFLNALNSVDNELFDLCINANNLPFCVANGSLLVINMPYVESSGA